MSLWTVCIVMHHGKSTKERGKVQLNEEDQMDSSCKNKAKEI